MEWVGPASKAKLNPAQYERIAIRLNKFRWHNDPPPPPLDDISSNQIDDRWWDIDSTAKAARQLRDSIPKMLVFQAGLKWAPETRDGHDVIQSLESALARALPYIERPFGEGTPARGRKRSKPWHIYAIQISNMLVRELQQAGHSKQPLSRNSVVVRVILKSLQRMQIPYSKTLSKTAIAAYLSRRNQKFGAA